MRVNIFPSLDTSPPAANICKHNFKTRILSLFSDREGRTDSWTRWKPQHSSARNRTRVLPSSTLMLKPLSYEAATGHLCANSRLSQSSQFFSSLQSDLNNPSLHTQPPTKTRWIFGTYRNLLWGGVASQCSARHRLSQKSTRPTAERWRGEGPPTWHRTSLMSGISRLMWSLMAKLNLAMDLMHRMVDMTLITLRKMKESSADRSPRLYCP